MDVKTLTFFELEQKLRYAEDEIARLKAENAYLHRLLALANDEADPELFEVANGEVLDASD